MRELSVHPGPADPLKALADIARAALAHADPATATTARTLLAWAEGRTDGPLEDALGIDRYRGGVSQRRAAAIARRDAELRDLAAAHPHLSAAAIARALADYHATGWARDADAVDVPPRLAHRLEARAWAVLRANGGRPLAERTIRKVISRPPGWFGGPTPAAIVDATES